MRGKMTDALHNALPRLNYIRNTTLLDCIKAKRLTFNRKKYSWLMENNFSSTFTEKQYSSYNQSL